MFRRERSIRPFLLAAIGALVAVAVAGCGGGDSATSAEPTVDYRKGKPALISTGTPSEGPEVLTSEWGYTLYVFSKDEAGSGKSTCYGRCEKTWWPLTTRARPEPWQEKPVPPGKLGAIERTDGRLQVTYEGRPLYRYRYDGTPDTQGLGREEFGGKWSAIETNGTLIDR